MSLSSLPPQRLRLVLVVLAIVRGSTTPASSLSSSRSCGSKSFFFSCLFDLLFPLTLIFRAAFTVLFAFREHLKRAKLKRNVAKFAALFKGWKFWTLATLEMQDFIAAITACKAYNPDFDCSPYIAVTFYILVRQFVVLYGTFMHKHMHFLEPRNKPEQQALWTRCKLVSLQVIFPLFISSTALKRVFLQYFYFL